MRVPSDQRFYLKTEEHLISEIRRLGLPLSVADEVDVLSRGFTAGGITVPNRFCARMMDGADAEENGSPSGLTQRRYERQVRGAFGLICTEPVVLAVDERRHPRQLLLSEINAAAFTRWLDDLRTFRGQEEGQATRWLLQLDDTGLMAYDTGAVCARFVAASRMAEAAGFDGVEIRCENATSLADIEAAIMADSNEPGTFDTASLRLVEVVQSIRSACPSLWLAVRLCVYTARCVPAGLGTDSSDFRHFDAEYPIRLARRLKHLGVGLLDITVNYPALRDRSESAMSHPVPPDGYPHEHPLTALARGISVAGTLREAVPGLAVMLGGFSWLRQFMPPVATAAVRDGLLDLVALDRFALAYPDAPADWFRLQRLDPYRCCIQCGACGELQRAGARTGCVIQESDLYGPVYRGRNDAVRLLAEAQRCHQCMPAFCSRATPGGLDIAGFMRAYARGDVQRAGRLLRSAQKLPEMCALLAPYGASGERDCIETALSGTAIAIRDLQYSAACLTRDDESAVVRWPEQASGLHVAVVGGGPAGLAAVATLLEYGHRVTLYERSGMLGGVPELLIPVARYGGAYAEIESLLGTARRAGRLDVRLKTVLGANVTLADVRSGTDALLLTMGLWKEKTLGAGGGIYSGLEFLEQAKAGIIPAFQGGAVVLAGGDCAMDAACVLKAMGADPLVILFGGSRADLHWCMEESWFAQPGVHARMLCRPTGYRLDARGQVSGIRVVHMEAEAGGGACDRSDGEDTIAVDRVVEAMGLSVTGEIRNALPELKFTGDGLLQRPDATSYATGVDGIFAAGALINGGASVPQCVEEGIRAAKEIHVWFSIHNAKSLVRVP